MSNHYYQQDGITIYHGDCREILPSLGPFDLCLTDPPYGIGANRMTLGNGFRKVYRGESDWDAKPIHVGDISTIREVSQWQIIWGGNYFDLPPARGWLVWDKGTGDNDYADCELAWTNLDSVVKKFTRSWVGANAKERGDADRFHPTQKPVDLMKWAIQRAPSPQTIIDPYVGSGTTLVAAKQLGRQAIGIELEEIYCEVAAMRLSQGVLDLA